MKNLKLVFAVLLLFGIAVVFNSCSQDDDLIESSVNTETYAFLKSFTITDESGLNSVDLIISSDDQSILDEYDAKNFTLNIYASLEELERKYSVSAKEVEDDECVSSYDEETIRIKIENTKFQSDVAYHSVSINKSEDADLRRSFRVYTFESTCDRGYIYRYSTFRRIYYNYDVKYNGTWTIDVRGESYALIPYGSHASIYEKNSEKICAHVRARYNVDFGGEVVWEND